MPTLTIEPGDPRLIRAQKLYEADELDDAYAGVQDVLAEEPDNPQALVLAAAVLKRADKTPIAWQLAKRAVELRPDRPEPWVTFGHCSQHMWRLDEAREAYQNALERAQSARQKATYINNLASIALDGGDFREAEKYTRRSLKHIDDPLTHHNLGLALLGQQKWREGWENYSASVGTFNRLVLKYNQKKDEPIWDGTKGQRVVVYGEQGLGDEISFASMIPDIANDCTVTLDCDKRLANLFRRSFPNVTVYGTRFEKQLNWKPEHRDIDASVSIGELGRFYRNETGDFPGTPYLKACPDRKAGWEEIFRRKEKPVIGIAWSGGTWNNGAKNRFLPLSKWAPIFEAVDAHWVSLQYKDASRDIEGTQVVQYPWATLTKDYDDTAALVDSCDLIITMQTAVAHLAGALGQKVWVMIPPNSQWRYGEATESLPWYNSMRIFKSEGDWGPVVERIAEEVGALFREPGLREVGRA